MNKQHLFVAFALILLLPPLTLGREPQTNEVSPFAPMRNRHVLFLVEKKLDSEAIVTIIKSSWCNFDTFPPVMQDLKRRGVPVQVLQAMVEAPYGPPANSKLDNAVDPQIYHYAEQLKQMGLLTWSAVRREDQNGFSSDRRGPGGILRR